MVQRALAHGFYVVWGVTGVAVLTATVWSAWKSYVTSTIVPWAQSNGLSELCLGNEFELHVDGTTITSATVRSDLRTLAASIKVGGFTGKLSYSTSATFTYRGPWVTEGIGVLDYIGWNHYEAFPGFDTVNQNIVSEFGINNTYISEFNSNANGYPDFNDETVYYNDALNRVNSVRNAGIQWGYFFCFRDGGAGVPTNSFGLIQTNNTANWAHYALKAITGKRIYALRAFGTPVPFGMGLMSVPSESVPLSDSAGFINNQSITSESVNVGENVTQTGLPSSTETVSLIDNIALVGKSQIIQSVLLSDSILLKAYKWYALRAFGSPVKLPLKAKSYALRAFGSPVKFNPRTTAYFVAPPDYATLSDSVSLLNSITFSSTVIKRYALRAFGSPVRIIFRPEVAALADVVFTSGSTTATPENVSVSEVTSLAGVPMPTDSVNALELTTSLLGSTQIVDSTPISDLSNPTGIVTIASESVQPGESTPALTGQSSPVESVLPADLTTIQGIISINPDSAFVSEVALPTGQPSTAENVQLGEGLSSFVGVLLSSDNAPLADQMILLGITAIATESVQLSDQSFPAGQPSSTDTVQPSEVLNSLAGQLSVSDSAPLTDQTALLGTISIASEIVLPSDVSALQGGMQNAEGVLISDQTTSQGAISDANAISAAENVSLLGFTQMAFESVLPGENNSQLGMTSNTIQIKQYALRTFGGVARYFNKSGTDVVRLGETVSFFTTTYFTAPPDSVPLSDLVSLIGSTQLVDNVQLTDLSTLYGGIAIAPEQVALSELIRLLGAINIADSVLLSDLAIAHVTLRPIIIRIRDGRAAVYIRDGLATVKGV